MDRKEWELTDQEVSAARGMALHKHPGPLAAAEVAADRAIATAAARKALEWAATRVAPLPDVEPTNDWERGYWAGENVSASLIRKELTDG